MSIMAKYEYKNFRILMKLIFIISKGGM